MTMNKSSGGQNIFEIGLKRVDQKAKKSFKSVLLPLHGAIRETIFVLKRR